MVKTKTGWQTQIQVQDLADTQKLECTCRQCGHVHYLYKATLTGREQDYIDEVQATEKCWARGCGGPVRIVFVRTDELSGFVGGMA
ncbi:hypothetical protein ANOBCDAF_03343 [Pleomorphomonas sp. T1.2MG-36]|uniref:hypothetical protein n=1 Tax=Pleomorphomonas sp. T1.2MG-36 TaxID=3041167 RepID=UPI002477BB9B|nr:hypothetical protein [Pleomorphomonas sp. T1.2MG-36]CAI9414967.1 hypothetical protein ANOBCDAF_03343 [Pleomorphomonas sp. T1.2MG-36]